MFERVKPYLTSESTPACFLIEALLIYNVVLVSGIQRSSPIICTYVYMLFSRFIFTIGYYKTLSSFLYSLYCYLFYTQ